MAPLGSFRALTFDCYGTLIDWETGLLGVLRPWAARVGLGPAGRGLDERLLGAFGVAEPKREMEEPIRLYPDVLRMVGRDIAAAMGVAPNERAAAALGEALAASVGDWPAFADTPAALASLKRRCRLVIVSNVDRASFARTNRRLGVEFDAVVTAEDVRWYKPALAHFRAALATLEGMGVAEREVLHVAQSLFHDHGPAKSMGLATCWIRRGRGRADEGAARVTREAAAVRPDFEFETLAELAAAMGASAPSG
jgi:2-haloalkanoic acid dehalogenase type II